MARAAIGVGGVAGFFASHQGGRGLGILREQELGLLGHSTDDGHHLSVAGPQHSRLRAYARLVCRPLVQHGGVGEYTAEEEAVLLEQILAGIDLENRAFRIECEQTCPEKNTEQL